VTIFFTKGRYTLPVRRKERPYVRASFFAPVRPALRMVDPYGPQEWIFDTRKRHPYVRPVEDTRTIPEALYVIYDVIL